MIAFTVDVMAQDEPVRDSSGIPDLFIEAIRNYWQPRPNGVIVGVMLVDHREPDWLALGEYLLDHLRACGTSIGLTFNADSTFPSEALTNWFQAIVRAEHDVGVVEVRLEAMHHPINKRVIGTEVTWNSVQPTENALWIRSLWRETGSHAFGQGCDLLVAAYRTDILPQLQQDECFSTSAFGQTLTQAIAWMIPIDENLGFMVGVPRDSDFHHFLVEHAIPTP